MTGNWQCRTIKVGGISPLVVYGWFKCRVSDDGSGWMLEKTQRLAAHQGPLLRRRRQAADLSRLVLSSPAITAKPYGSGPDSDQFGYAFRTGAKAFRIELPAPRYESKLDILEFRR